jgi:UDP-N-acetylmuramoyl-tripeptide--D-alanyl-D-alanine ligase
MRMERCSAGGVTIINDAYNANPASMAAALLEFSRMSVPGQKCLICGDMAELGGEAVRLHTELGERIAKAAVDLLLVTGRFAREVARAARGAGMAECQIKVCNSLEEVYGTATVLLKEGDTVLLKGSRCMHLEEVCSRLKEYFSSRPRRPAAASDISDYNAVEAGRALSLSEERETA